MRTDNFYELKRCKMDWLDDIFLGTKESQGTRNACSAIKFVLFDDCSMIPDGFKVGDKYEFISSRRDGRAKAKMLQPIDLVQILCKYAMQSFGISHREFEITYDDYANFRRNKVINQNFNGDYIIELVSYALMDSVYGAYILVSGNKYLRESLLESLINERYIENKLSELDSFNGELEYPGIDDMTKKNFLDNYNNLDDDFLNIKRRDNGYISFLDKVDSYEKNS